MSEPLSPTFLPYVVLALLLGLAAGGWCVAAWQLGLRKGPGRHWALGCVCALISVLVALSMDHTRQSALVALGNLGLVGGLLCLARGLQQFVEQTLNDRLDALLLGAVLLIGVADIAIGLPPQARAPAVGLLVAVLALRASAQVAAPLRQEFGLPTAALVVVPLLLTAAVFLGRALLLLLRGESGRQTLTEAGTVNAISAVAFTLVAVLVNGVLGYLVARRQVLRFQQLARQDGLTGLGNRSGLALAEQKERRRGRAGSWALLMIDVDHFKAINDGHGHARGDEVLREVAQLLRATARPSDTVTRTGGEEFCLLLPQTNLVGAARLGERLRAAVAAGQPAELAVTVSIGAAAQPEGGEEALDALMARADAALYRAKAAGRNRVMVDSGC